MRSTALLQRLRERGVLRVAASYAVIAWLVLQIADVVLEPWDVPAWVERAPLIVALLGFPVALAVAWFYELGDRGISVDAAGEGVTRPGVHGLRRYADMVIISLLPAMVGYFVMRDAGLARRHTGAYARRRGHEPRSSAVRQRQRSARGSIPERRPE